MEEISTTVSPASLHRLDLVIRDTRISVLRRDADTAQPKRAPLVLAHGLIAEGETFRRLIECLPADRDIFAIDLPGAGFSDRNFTLDVSFEGMASVVLEAMALLGLERPVLLGHSHGGSIALRLAATYRDALSGLMLISPPHAFSTYDDRLIRFYLSPIGRLFAHSLPRLPWQVHLFAFQRMPGIRKHLTYADMAPFLHTLRAPGTVRHILRMLETWSADKAQLGRDLATNPLALPILVMWGDHDPVVPLKTAPPFLALLPNHTLKTIAGVGHLPTEEAPEETAADMIEWLDEAGL